MPLGSVSDKERAICGNNLEEHRNDEGTIDR